MACEHTGFNHCGMCGYTGDSKDARIAELEAEVARLKETIEAYKDRDRDEWGEAVWVDGE